MVNAGATSRSAGAVFTSINIVMSDRSGQAP